MNIYYKADESHPTPHGMVNCDEQGVVHEGLGIRVPLAGSGFAETNTIASLTNSTM